MGIFLWKLSWREYMTYDIVPTAPTKLFTQPLSLEKNWLHFYTPTMVIRALLKAISCSRNIKAFPFIAIWWRFRHYLTVRFTFLNNIKKLHSSLSLYSSPQPYVDNVIIIFFTFLYYLKKQGDPNVLRLYIKFHNLPCIDLFANI